MICETIFDKNRKYASTVKELENVRKKREIVGESHSFFTKTFGNN